MLYNKLLKIKHFFKSKVLKNSNISKLLKYGVEGNLIAQAFLKTLKKENTPDEDQLFKKLNQFRSDLLTDNRKISFEKYFGDRNQFGGIGSVLYQSTREQKKYKICHSGGRKRTM